MNTVRAKSRVPEPGPMYRVNPPRPHAAMLVEYRRAYIEWLMHGAPRYAQARSRRGRGKITK